MRIYVCGLTVNNISSGYLAKLERILLRCLKNIYFLKFDNLLATVSLISSGNTYDVLLCSN